jgi:hypothetical protein
MRRHILFALACLSAGALAAEPPFNVAPNLFDFARPDDIGLKPAPGAQTFIIFRAGRDTDHYVNGVVLMPFKGRLYAQWQTSARDEDAPDTHVVYAVSSDGERWPRPRPLTRAGSRMTTSGGWWTDGITLVAYINVWPKGFDTGFGGYAEYMTSADGRHWSKPRRVTGVDGKPIDGIIEQDPHALPDGRIVTAFHERPGLIVSPYYTDDPKGISGWTKGIMKNLPQLGPRSRELEPSWFRRIDGCLVMVFRDQAYSFRQIASASCDRGANWTAPVLTAMPDSRAKQSAGNLPDGTAFLVNAPSGNKLRAPLAVTLSKDGLVFDRAFLLRAGPPPQLNYPGQYKRPGYHYPKSVVWNGALYVGYATGKQSVEITRAPVAALH